MDAAVDARQRDGRAPRAPAGRRRHAERGPALARGRRALRARPPRPRRLPRRPRRRQARHARRGQALPGDARLLRQRPHAARRDGRPGQRARGRRHRGDDRLRGAARRRLARPTSTRCSSASRTPTSATAPAALEDDGRRRARARGPRQHARRRRCTTSATAPINFGAGGEDASVIQLVHRVIKEAVERGASDIHFEPGDEEMRVRYRIDGVLQEAAVDPRQRRARRRLAREDPLRPRHRRAPHPAGRPHLDGGREQADRPARRHAAVRLRRERRHAHPRPAQGHDRARAARHAAAGARALHQGVRAGPRRGARHRPDRLRQVDVALRRAQPAQHDREEHHHDRGPGRVPARRHHPGPGQQQGRA